MPDPNPFAQFAATPNVAPPPANLQGAYNALFDAEKFEAESAALPGKAIAGVFEGVRDRKVKKDERSQAFDENARSQQRAFIEQRYQQAARIDAQRKQNDLSREQAQAQFTALYDQRDAHFNAEMAEKERSQGAAHGNALSLQGNQITSTEGMAGDRIDASVEGQAQGHENALEIQENEHTNRLLELSAAGETKRMLAVVDQVAAENEQIRSGHTMGVYTEALVDEHDAKDDAVYVANTVPGFEYAEVEDVIDKLSPLKATMEPDNWKALVAFLSQKQDAAILGPGFYDSYMRDLIDGGTDKREAIGMMQAMRDNWKGKVFESREDAIEKLGSRFEKWRPDIMVQVTRQLTGAPSTGYEYDMEWKDYQVKGKSVTGAPFKMDGLGTYIDKLPLTDSHKETMHNAVSRGGDQFIAMFENYKVGVTEDKEGEPIFHFVEGQAHDPGPTDEAWIDVMNMMLKDNPDVRDHFFGQGHIGPAGEMSPSNYQKVAMMVRRMMADPSADPANPFAGVPETPLPTGTSNTPAAPLAPGAWALQQTQ